MTPEAVVFDLGKVLVDFDYSIAIRKIAARCKISLAEVAKFIDQSPLLFDLECGQIGKEEFFKAVCAFAGFDGTLAEFSGYFADIFTEIPPMIDLHAQLRARGFPTYIFSNTNELAIVHIQQGFPFFKNFDGYIYSYEHRAMKPDLKLYEVVERVSGRSGAQILYLDDRPENAEAGLVRGWQVIHHVSPEETAERVRKLGML